MNKRVFIEIVTFITIVLFLYTGIIKLTDYSTLKELIALSPILKPFAGFVAWFLPLVELVAATLLFLPNWRRVGLYASFGLMAVFTIYVAAIMLINDQLPCSCGGIIEQLSWKQHLFFNCFWTLLLFIAIRFHKQVQVNMQTSSATILKEG